MELAEHGTWKIASNVLNLVGHILRKLSRTLNGKAHGVALNHQSPSCYCVTGRDVDLVLCHVAPA